MEKQLLRQSGRVLQGDSRTNEIEKRGTELSKNEDHLNAILWECERVGLSYGKLVSRYSSEQLDKVYHEYEKTLAEKKGEKKIIKR